MTDKTDFTDKDIAYVKDLVAIADRRGQSLFINPETIHLLLARLHDAEALIDALDDDLSDVDTTLKTKRLYNAWYASKGEAIP